MEKVKIEIPLSVLHEMIVRFDLSVDEAIDVAVKGAVDVIKDDLKNQYYVYKNLKEGNDGKEKHIH